MMGVSPYKTRAELLREMHTGVAADVDIATQKRFDNGHRARGPGPAAGRADRRRGSLPGGRRGAVVGQLRRPDDGREPGLRAQGVECGAAGRV